mgnify:CR=1 FL=1
MSDFPIEIDRSMVPEMGFFDAVANKSPRCSNCGISGKPDLIIYKEGNADPLLLCSKSCAAEHFVDQVNFTDE